MHKTAEQFSVVESSRLHRPLLAKANNREQILRGSNRLNGFDGYGEFRKLFSYSNSINRPVIQWADGTTKSDYVEKFSIPLYSQLEHQESFVKKVQHLSPFRGKAWSQK